MPHRYSSARLFVQATLKNNLVVAARKAFQAHRAKAPMSPNTNNNPEWEELFEHRPTGRFTLDNRVEDTVRLSELTVTYDEQFQATDGEAQEDSLSDNSSIASEPLSTLFEASDGVTSISWQLAQGRKGRLHLVVGDCLACSRTLKLPESGSGVNDAASTLRSWSPRCYASLPDDVKLWWDANAIKSVMMDADS